jgi:hypothetical protein
MRRVVHPGKKGYSEVLFRRMEGTKPVVKKRF